MLAGDFIVRALRARKRSAGSGLASSSVDGAPAGVASDQGGTDPGNIGEFLAYDVPFGTPPAQGFVFPPEAPDG